MSLGIYLNPLDQKFLSEKNWKKQTIGQTISQYVDDLKLVDYDIALIGVMEQRGHKGVWETLHRTPRNSASKDAKTYHYQY